MDRVTGVIPRCGCVVRALDIAGLLAISGKQQSRSGTLMKVSPGWVNQAVEAGDGRREDGLLGPGGDLKAGLWSGNPGARVPDNPKLRNPGCGTVNAVLSARGQNLVYDMARGRSISGGVNWKLTVSFAASGARNPPLIPFCSFT
jgi:hypothetical protein